MSAPIVAKIIDAQAMSGTNVITSAALQVKNCSRISLQAIWSGTPTGTWKFKVSNHPQAVLDNGALNPLAKFTTLTVPSTFTSGNPAGSASDFEFEFAEMGCQFLLAEYTNSSGSGTLDMYGSAKP